MSQPEVKVVLVADNSDGKTLYYMANSLEENNTVTSLDRENVNYFLCETDSDGSVLTLASLPADSADQVDTHISATGNFRATKEGMLEGSKPEGCGPVNGAADIKTTLAESSMKENVEVVKAEVKATADSSEIKTAVSVAEKSTCTTSDMNNTRILHVRETLTSKPGLEDNIELLEENISSPSTEADADFEDDIEINDMPLLNLKEDGTEAVETVYLHKNTRKQTRSSRKKDDNRFKCPHCSEMIRVTYLNQHIKNVHEENNHICPVCGVLKSNSAKMSRHIKLYHSEDVKIYSCPECDYKTKFEATFQRHVKGHMYRRGELQKPFQCKRCEKRFVNVTTLKTHMTLHTGYKPFKCEICEKEFAQKHNYQVHVEKHVKGNKASLDGQGGLVVSGNVQNVMEGSAYTGKFKRKLCFPCEKCGKMFRWKHDMKRHIKTVHLGIKQYKCNICDKKFIDKSALSLHVLSTHKQDVTFNCTLCTKKYYSKYKLKSHMEEKHNVDTKPLIHVSEEIGNHPLSNEQNVDVIAIPKMSN